ncbi:alpha-L-rhamnosidase N-terminal domain-containing protein [Niabella pedocola]|uniref:Alpha-L-rhamnosidase N-terminal domain-containing protein n=1 Tax=Niabella pedocola TaxID=1752077 RepID=A0ABS8PRG0_9BACT|nr:alpha-L-rhamnosidase C-terminal domain-containing protein [Niabella pedocola]MCD2423671.1 alpha-L-rhamnosidase N-terminal domain-containing protein [Niabella pedocola]
MSRWTLLMLFLICCSRLQGQQDIACKASEQWRQHQWNAHWITVSQDAGSKYDYGIHRFRKAFSISAVPETFVINLSADPRYEFFVNGTRVCRGPARGSLYNWHYETIDIAQFLKKGQNLIAATVWNYGEWSPGAQISMYTGFIVQGESEQEAVANTDGTWKVSTDRSFSPSLVYLQDVGPGDIIQGETHPWNWNTADFDDAQWKNAEVKERGQPAGTGTQYLRALTPRSIPLMEAHLEGPMKIRRSEGIDVKGDFIPGKEALKIPPHSKVSILLDQEYLTNAYPALTVSKGARSKIAVTYSEAMYLDARNKGNRNEIDGKHINGFVDVFYPEGGSRRVYSPLWFRTFRYIQLDIETTTQELLLHSFDREFTGYPFKEKGRFSCNDPALQEIWKAGWRTARLCAGETYYDCPYYEQLQYTGDTRIQGLISLYVSGDDRLMRKAITDIASSVTPEGILLSRYPARYNQVIPPFSLYWINMLHDYWMYRDDKAFVASYLPILKSILNWFEHKIDPQTGLLGPLPHWNFVDWPVKWPWDDRKPLGGTPPAAIAGGSSILSLQLAYALADAAALLEVFNETALAAKYKKLQQSIGEAAMKQCFDQQRGLMADDRTHSRYSQHASIMGILSEAISRDQQQRVFEKLNSDTSLTPATVYYRFYLFRAMKKAGLADRYTSSLDIWKTMLKNGLTTFAEQPEPSRSDCHAWSASPNYDLLATVCGITPAAPGFRKVHIAPHLGTLKWVKAAMPHTNGEIRVFFEQRNGRLTGSITLPPNLYGVFEHKGVSRKLVPGTNVLN